jgi:membrane protein YdbS with pleckstrin-like domain
MYHSPPPMDDEAQRARLRRLIVWYTLLASALNAYVTTWISRMMDEFIAQRAWLAVLLLALCVTIMYAPFINTMRLSVYQWTQHMRHILIGSGALILAFEAYFLWYGVYSPTFSGTMAFVCSLIFGIPGSLGFVKKRLELI